MRLMSWKYYNKNLKITQTGVKSKKNKWPIDQERIIQKYINGIGTRFQNSINKNDCIIINGEMKLSL